MLHLTINQSGGVPIYRQLVRQIKGLIARKRLVENDELPAVRVLAQQLVINPNTVVRAYRELEMEGLVYKRIGAGTYVSGGGTPYTAEECRRILSEHVDVLLVEGSHLGYDLDRLIDLLKERDGELRREDATEEGA